MLIICLVATNISYVGIAYANDTNYQFVDEIEVEDAYIDDGMFYLPHKSLEVNEGGDNNKKKYVFKVVRKGNAEKEEKVKISMLDISGKYNKDYSIKVIDKAFFSENVENIFKSKSIDEFMRQGEYEEYNLSDAIVNGVVTNDDLMTDEEKENHTFSDEEKNDIVNAVGEVLKEYDLADKVDVVGTEPEENEVETEKETEEEKVEEKIEEKTEEETPIKGDAETVSAFTNSDNSVSLIGETEQTSVSGEKREAEEKGEAEEKSEAEEKNEAVEKSEAEEKKESEEESEAEEKSETEETIETEETSQTEETSTAEQKSETESTSVTEQKSEIESTSVTEQTSETESTNVTEQTSEIESTSVTEQTSETEQTNITEQTSETVSISVDNQTDVTASTSDILESISISESLEIAKTLKQVPQSTISELNIATESYILYGDENVQFEHKKATKSISDWFEMATGLKDDRKIITPNRNLNNLPLSPNSLENKTFMREGIQAVEEELNSAYVILNFKSGQKEKLIEINILNDNKYRGDRQVGFSLSGVDGSQVAGAYSSMTLIMHDDEEEVATYINFTKTSYEPKDGYITVEIERTGSLASLASCMIDTEEITAKEGRDFSKVHAELVFGMGADKRTIKIPIMSDYVMNKATFILKLQEPKGALIGDKGTATCTIRKNDTNFKYASDDENNNDKEKTLFGAGNNTLEQSKNNTNSTLYGAGGKDYDLDSTILGPEIDLKSAIFNIKTSKANSSSYQRFINNNKGFKVYLENHDFFGEMAWTAWCMTQSNMMRGWSGFQFDWSIDSSNNGIEISELDRSSGKWKDIKEYDRKSWGRRTDNLLLTQDVFSHLYFYLFRYDGFFRTSPTLTIESIKPILKMYKINLLGSEVPKLIDDTGKSTTANKYAQYALTTIDGAKSDGTAVGWTDKTITVKLTNTINNPFYIKSLMIKKDGKSSTIVTNKDTSATSISFKITEDFLRDFDSYINKTNKPGGGRNGAFSICAEIGTKPSLVKVENDSRVKIKIWDTIPPESGAKYSVGDTLHFTAEINPEYKNVFKCDGLNIYWIKPYSPEWITIRRPTSGVDYFPLGMEFSEIKVVPLLSQDNNSIVVKVKKDMVDLFDKKYGIFSTAKSFENGDYMDYYVETDSSKICGNYFEIKARCQDSNNVPVWHESYKPSMKFTQNTYNFLGTENKDNNIIYLAAEKGDDIEYSITGKAYYEETPIGGKTVDKYWQVAPNVGIKVDDAHYAYADKDGAFATFPGKGKNGYYNQIKIISNGANKYLNIKLSSKNKVKKTYDITYEDGERKISKDVYEVVAEEILISNTQNVHPYVSGVKVLNALGSSYGAVYINDESSILKASVVTKKPDGSDFAYSYTDIKGVNHTDVEKVKGVEFVAVDMRDHSIKKVIKATPSNNEKTEWVADYQFRRGKYNEYMSGDKLYVRIVTDKKIGDGQGYDIDGSGQARSIPIFNETTYQAISTAIPFIEESVKEPYRVDINLPDAKSYAIKLPIIGDMATNLNLLGMVFTIKQEGDKISLGIGKKFKGKGNRYDGQGKKVSDTGSKIDLSNIMQGINDMADLIKSSGTERLKTMTLGIPTWMIEPTIGATFAFMLYHDPKSKVSKRFEFVGGSAYFGVSIDLRYTFYFLIGGFPFFIGGQVAILLVAELGIAADPGKHIPFNDPDQGFFDSLLKNSHFEFLIRGELKGSAFVGAGIAGTVGVRGGYQLTLKFIWNPLVPDVRPVGFSVTGSMMFWIDALLVNFSIPAYKWREPLNLGYFEDIAKIKEKGNNANNSNLYGGEEDIFKRTEFELRPRFGNGSKFVANDNIERGLFGGTYTEEGTKTLIEDVYDDSSPNLIKYGDNKALLIYIDDDKEQSDIERTEITYMIYDGTKGEKNAWTEPKPIVDDDRADFSPNVCDCGDKILVSWASRYEKVDSSSEKKEMLERMEIYATFFDKKTGTFGKVERITNDNNYDYCPKAVYDPYAGIVYLYYLKDLKTEDIITYEDFFNALQTESNGAFLMYMIYDDPEGAPGGATGTKHWVRDYYYDYELSSSLTPEEKQEFIDMWKGQRFQDISIGAEANNPCIKDYTLICDDMYDVNNDDILSFLRSKGYDSESEVPESEYEEISREFKETFKNRNKIYKGIIYAAECDGNIDTKADTDIFIKLHYATSSEVKTIRITNNKVSDLMPQVVNTVDEDYLFWIQNESMIKMVSFDNIIKKASVEGDQSNGIIAGDVNIITTDNFVISDKINSFCPFVDENDNVYILWQQNSKNEYKIDENGDIEFEQDIYMAGLIKSDDNDGNKVSSWSKPIKLTDNDELNGLPSVAEINNKLLMVNNQFRLVSHDESYDIYDSKLQATTYKPASSLEGMDILTYEDTISDNGDIKYNVEVKIENTGINVAYGYDYYGKITYDGRVLTDIVGSSGELLAPGNDTMIGGMALAASTSVATPIISITLSEAERRNIDKVKINLTIVEKAIGDSGISIDDDLFDIKERFTITDLGEYTEEDNPYNNLTAYQEGDQFVIKGVITNVGNIYSKKNERIYVINQDDWDKPVAMSDYIDLAVNEQMQFAIPIDNSVITNEYGIDELVLYVKNDDGEILSDYSLAEVNAITPYNFKVNNKTDEIVVRLGETINLTTTFEPKSRYRSATVLYTVEDNNIAENVDDKLIGLKVGTTKMKLTTEEFGGNKEIEVKVVQYRPSPGGDTPGGGSGGGGGGGGLGPITYRANVSTIQNVKANTLSYNSKDVAWVYDPINDSWKLNVKNIDAQMVEARNGFYLIQKEKVTIVDGIENVGIVNETYCFDNDGKMLTGWVGTTDGKWYFFEDTKAMDQGKMVFGWRNVQGAWYYFGEDGAMYQNQITPDGYFIGADGKWIQV